MSKGTLWFELIVHRHHLCIPIFLWRVIPKRHKLRLVHLKASLEILIPVWLVMAYGLLISFCKLRFGLLEFGTYNWKKCRSHSLLMPIEFCFNHEITHTIDGIEATSPFGIFWCLSSRRNTSRKAKCKKIMSSSDCGPLSVVKKSSFNSDEQNIFSTHYAVFKNQMASRIRLVVRIISIYFAQQRNTWIFCIL